MLAELFEAVQICVRDGPYVMLQQLSNTSQAVNQTSHDAHDEDLMCYESLSGVFEGACLETSPLKETLYFDGGRDDLMEDAWEQVQASSDPHTYHASADDEMSQTPKEMN